MHRMITSTGALIEADFTPEEELALMTGKPVALRGRVRYFSPDDAGARLRAQRDQIAREREQILADHDPHFAFLIRERARLELEEHGIEPLDEPDDLAAA